MAAELADATTDGHSNPGLEEGFALALQAEDRGEWKPLVQWFARHPREAGEVAQFLVDQDRLRDAMKCPGVVDRAGATVVGLEILEELGRGMNVVYKAYDTRLKREVAVKFERPHTELSTAQQARFRFEAEVAASFDHPNVVPIHSLIESTEGLYLVMPLMTGGSLASRLKQRGPDRILEPRLAAELVRDIALGVHHAHQRGLIHRDLKPANILFDGNDRPHVTDFGLARPIDATATSIAGTPAYMAPEQARADKHLSTAVDIHALGVILFELLTGRVPFGGENVASALRRVAEENAPLVRTFNRDVPRDLETICARCLKKSPEERFPSAQALAEALQHFIDGKPIDDSRAWIWNTVLDALNRKKEVTGWTTSGVLFWGAASTFLAMGVMQAAVLLEWPMWVSQVAIAYYLLAWLGIMWRFLVARRDTMITVERASTAIYFGAKFSCMAILPVQLWQHDGDPLYALPAFLALVGLSIYMHGLLYRGRYFIDGLIFFVVVAAFPLLPVKFWPGVYGLMLGGAQMITGYHVYSESRRARAAIGS